MKIVVFDSGMGSLSIIKSIQKVTKAEIIYFADQKNYPYGKKSKSELKKIIQTTIRKIKQKFEPDMIIIASNTPSILFSEFLNGDIIGVLPPVKLASKISKTKNIAILATSATIKSKELNLFIKKESIGVNVKRIDASELIDLVESGKFLTNKKFCRKIIRSIGKHFEGIDVITLSSTHLPFLLPLLKTEFRSIKFLDPAESIAKKISLRMKKSKRNRLRIYTSKEPKILQRNLQRIGIKNRVNFLA